VRVKYALGSVQLVVLRAMRASVTPWVLSMH
jgi:hypothetical protein